MKPLLLVLALTLSGCTPLAYQSHPEVWNPACHDGSCGTDDECARLCGGNGDPEPVCPDGKPFDEWAADANRDGCTGEPFPD